MPGCGYNVRLACGLVPCGLAWAALLAAFIGIRILVPGDWSNYDHSKHVEGTAAAELRVYIRYHSYSMV